MKPQIFILIFALLKATSSVIPAALPVAIFHGLGDSCSSDAMTMVVDSIHNASKAYTKCIEVGNGRLSSFFMSFEEQAYEACISLRNDPNFNGLFNVIGFSQGGLLARWIIESCSFSGKVVKYISVGTPQMGIARVPFCIISVFCDAVNYVAKRVVYWSWVQRLFGPAGYYHAYDEEANYREGSTFLSLLNNEAVFSQQRYERLAELEMLLIRFKYDQIIYPESSAWFGFLDYEGRQVRLGDTSVYKEDRLPLQSLFQSGRMHFDLIEKGHMQITYGDIYFTFLRFFQSPPGTFKTFPSADLLDSRVARKSSQA